MSFSLVRPVTNHDQRLYYRSQYEIREGCTGGHYLGRMFRPSKGNTGMYSLSDPGNMLCQLRVWRWMMHEYERQLAEIDPRELAVPGSFSNSVLKDELRDELFEDMPTITTRRMGRLIRMVVPYEVSFQKNRSPSTGGRNLMYWRWCHPLEIAYGIEHLMSHWLPAAVDGIADMDEWEEEMEVIRDARPEEDLEFLESAAETSLQCRW